MNQSLELQQQALYQLQNHLASFKEILLDNLERYRNIVEGLHQDGLSNEVYNTYLNAYFGHDRSLIQNLIRHLEDSDAPYIASNLEATGVSKETAARGWDW